jgi:hypothetical protein
MDVLNRYLQAVRFFLPRAHRDDILRELRENLISQMEEREEELGRPLTEDEQADIVRKHGHPMLVASRYRAHAYLIGPAFYSIYLFTLKLGLVAALLVVGIEAAIGTMIDGDPIGHGVRAMLTFPGRGLMVFAWTTMVFAALDWAGARFYVAPQNWNPKHLPKVMPGGRGISRSRAACELLLLSAAFVWLLIVPQRPELAFGPAASFLAPSPVWGTVYLPIVVLTIASAVLALANVVAPHRDMLWSVLRLVLNAAGIPVLVILLRADAWLVPIAATLPNGEPIEPLVDIVNTCMYVALRIAAVIKLFDIARDVWRLLRRHHTATPPDSSSARFAAAR